MPVQLKDPSIQEDRLKFAEVDGSLEVEAILHEASASHDSVAKFFAPKSFVAKNEFEARKEKQRQNREWLANIADRRTQLQNNQQRLTEMVNKSRNGTGSGVGI